MIKLKNKKSHFACLRRQKFTTLGLFLLKIKIKRKQKLDSLLLGGENNSETFKNCQPIWSESPPPTKLIVLMP